jgi:hypothetical protein
MHHPIPRGQPIGNDRLCLALVRCIDGSHLDSVPESKSSSGTAHI